MKRKFPIASFAVFIAWSALDFVIHGMLLQKTYQATASMWRPMDDMNIGLMHAVTLIAALAFTGIYHVIAREKSPRTGVVYGLLYGVATGVSMGFGSYCYMPIPLSLAWGWLLGTLVEATAGGLIAGAILRQESGT